MPSVTTPVLTLTESGNNVTCAIEYTITFSPIEQFLAANGLQVSRLVQLFGASDPPDSQLLFTVVSDLLQVPVSGSLSMPQKHEVTVSRSVLDEDPSLINWSWTHEEPTLTGGTVWVTDYFGSADYIKAKVRVDYQGFGPSSSILDSVFSVLGGPDFTVVHR
jgi:hypothetical protein